MKNKLLKKLRNRGRGCINIISITRTNNVITGMSYGYDDDDFKGLFDIGDDEFTVKEKAARIYIKKYLESIKK